MNYLLIDWIIIFTLFLITLGIGISLRFDDYKKIFAYPKTILTGLSLQIIALPLVAFLIAYLSGLPPAFQVGLVIIAACPGGANSNSVTFILEGNTALSISLTSINGFLTLVSIPIIVTLALYIFIGEASRFRLPLIETILQIGGVTILPAFLGAYINSHYSDFVDKNKKLLKRSTMLLLLLVFVIKFFASKEMGGSGIQTTELFQILPYTLLLNFATLTLGFLVAKSISLEKINQLTVSIEVGVQNTTLAFLIAGTLLQNQEMIKPALAYGIFTFWAGLVYGFFIKKIYAMDKQEIVATAKIKRMEEEIIN